MENGWLEYLESERAMAMQRAAECEAALVAARSEADWWSEKLLEARSIVRG